MIKTPLHCMIMETERNSILCGIDYYKTKIDYDLHYFFIDFVNNTRKLYSDNYLCEDCVKYAENLIFK